MPNPWLWWQWSHHWKLCITPQVRTLCQCPIYFYWLQSFYNEKWKSPFLWAWKAVASKREPIYTLETLHINQWIHIKLPSTVQACSLSWYCRCLTTPAPLLTPCLFLSTLPDKCSGLWLTCCLLLAHVEILSLFCSSLSGCPLADKSLRSLMAAHSAELKYVCP